jgi:hypothetical protein
MTSFLGVQAFPTTSHFGFATWLDPMTFITSFEASFSARMRSPSFTDKGDNSSDPFAKERDGSLDQTSMYTSLELSETILSQSASPLHRQSVFQSTLLSHPVTEALLQTNP